MKKALINPLDTPNKMAATEYGVEIYHKNDEVIELTFTQYSYSEVFDAIKEYYTDKNDNSVEKVIIEVKR